MTEAICQTDYLFAGVEMRCILTGRETGSSFCLFENTSPGNSGTPIHSHSFEDETLLVLEGTMNVVIAGAPQVLQPGQAAFLPRGIPHQLKNESGLQSRYIILCTPSGFEDFVATAGHTKSSGEVASLPTPAEIRTMKELAPEFGITIFAASPR